MITPAVKPTATVLSLVDEATPDAATRSYASEPFDVERCGLRVRARLKRRAPLAQLGIVPEARCGDRAHVPRGSRERWSRRGCSERAAVLHVAAGGSWDAHMQSSVRWVTGQSVSALCSARDVPGRRGEAFNRFRGRHAAKSHCRSNERHDGRDNRRYGCLLHWSWDECQEASPRGCPRGGGGLGHRGMDPNYAPRPPQVKQDRLSVAVRTIRSPCANRCYRERPRPNEAQ
jgi:hypothetical protein